MKITEIPHVCDKFFLNGDSTSPENYVVINDQKEVFRNGNLLNIKGDYSLGFPKVKILSNDQFILVDGEFEGKEHNAWIINSKGGIEKSLFLGGVNRMTATKNHIICSYFDSQLGTNSPYGQNGLVVFDYEGTSQFEYYRDEEKGKQLNFIENYAFLEKDENTIYYMPYQGFPIAQRTNSPLK